MTETQQQPKLESGAWCVQVWLVTGYNRDRKDVIAGGSPILGPYTWVIEAYKDAFIAEMQKRYGHRTIAIKVHDRQFCKMDKIPTLEEQIAIFEEYLKKPGTFPPIGDED